MSDFIPVNTPLLQGNEKQYLNECIDTGWVSSEGPFIQRLEKSFSERVGRTYGICVANGTAALQVAIRALELPKGSEVILPTFCIISCIQAVLENECVPVLVDCCPNTWNMTPEAVEQAITGNTSAILLVHTYGLPVDMDPILKLAQAHQLRVIEDAAEVIGQTYKGKPCCGFGDVSVVSFYPNKHMTTGEGGMVLTDDEHLYERSKSLRNLCFGAKRFVHEELGWNYRMTNLQAALGVAQLEQLDNALTKKRAIGHDYDQAFQALKAVQRPVAETDYAQNIYWVYGIVMQSESVCDAVMKTLAQKKIGTRPFFWPMHEQPVFKGRFQGHYPHAESLARCGFYLPSGLGLTQVQQKRVITVVTEVLA